MTTESLSLLHRTLEVSPDGILIEHENAIVWINAAYRRLLGYSAPSELAGRDTATIIAPDDQPRLATFTQRRADGDGAPQRYRFRALRRDRSPVMLDASVSSVRAGNDFFITTIVRPLEASPAANALEQLSNRERDIALRTLRGQRPKEIAYELRISEKTVATHRCRIFRKLALRHDLDLYRLGAQCGLLDEAGATGRLSADNCPPGRVSDTSDFG